MSYSIHVEFKWKLNENDMIEYMVGKLNAERHRIAKNITNEKTF